MSGSGVPLDPEKAVSLFRKAAAKGHGDSQTRLGVMYSNGEKPFAKDDAKAVGMCWVGLGWVVAVTAAEVH
jgi:TPR repeat protein